MKDFDLDDAPSPDMRTRGPEFRLGGETFRCLPVVPGGLVGDIVLSFTQQNGVTMRDVSRCIYVIEQLLVERLWVEDGITVDVEGEPPAGPTGTWEPADDVQRWNALLKSKTVVVEAPKLVAVFDWLLSEYSTLNARPTQPSGR